MFDYLLQWDKKLLLYLNNSGSPNFDGLWIFITEIKSWTPLFLLFTLLFILKFSIKQAIQRIGILALLIFTIMGLCNIVKIGVGRLRPCNDEAVNPMLRILINPSDFSFFSGHASSSFAITVLVYLLLKDKVKWAGIFFIWPLLFSYSRLYLGVHYPSDIFVGAVVGTVLAWLFYRGFIRLFHSTQSKPISNGQ